MPTPPDQIDPQRDDAPAAPPEAMDMENVPPAYPGDAKELPARPNGTLRTASATPSGHSREATAAARIPKKLPALGELFGKTTYPVAWEAELRYEVADWDAWTRDASKVESPVLQARGTNWRFLVFPQGNNNQGSDLSVYIVNEDVKATPEGDAPVELFTDFAIGVVNAADDTAHVFQTAEHCFSGAEVDWGFTRLVPLEELHRGSATMRPLLEGGRVVLLAHVRCYEHPDCRGLKNQGATCYMNSILQSLYTTNYFRKATFMVPTQDEDPTASIALALQRVFYNLQFRSTAASTTELTRSFKWDRADAFMQHDIQEFNRVLQDALEAKMKGTKAEGAISKLFQGKMKSYIKCINVDFESSRLEEFYDVQLTVKNCPTLLDSFRDYCAEETLEGDNKYQSEKHGLQDARKGVIFTQLPPVLHLQLRRFEYDFARDAMVKINDRHEYPLVIDLAEFVEGGAANGPQKYHLYGVLVHSGDSSGGHYYAFLQTQRRGGTWAKFDDDRVTPATRIETVLDDNYGGEYPSSRLSGRVVKRYANAYMLVYIREADLDWVMAPVTQSDIPRHLGERVEQERAVRERELAQLREQRKYFTTTVLTDAIAQTHHGFDLCSFDGARFEQTVGLQSVQTHREMTLAEWLAAVAGEMGAPAGSVRAWTFTKRQNGTVRLDGPIPPVDLTRPMEAVATRYAHLGEPLRLYIEQSHAQYEGAWTFPAVRAATPVGEPAEPNAPPLLGAGDSDPLVIALKWYDPAQCLLSYVGLVYVKSLNERVGTLLAEFRQRLGLPANAELAMVEEIKPGMIGNLDTEATFGASELMTGDVIVAQHAAASQSPMPLATDFYAFLQSQIPVTFYHRPRAAADGIVVSPTPSVSPLAALSPAPQPPRDPLTLRLSRTLTYDQVAQQLGLALDVDPQHIQLLEVGVYGSSRPIPPNKPYTLVEMVKYQPYAAAQPAEYPLGYEITEVSLDELQRKRYIRVHWLDGQLREHGPFEVLVDKTADLAQLLESVNSARLMSESVASLNSVASTGGHSASVATLPAAQASAPGSPSPNNQPPPATRLRLVEVSDHRIAKVYANLAESVALIAEHSALYAEEVPADQVELPAQDERMIQVVHMDTSGGAPRLHGIPFVFLLRHNETVADLRQRLRARMGVGSKELSKAKVALAPTLQLLVSGRFQYLEDGAVVSGDAFNDDVLALDHPDRSRQLRPVIAERGIKIG